MLSYQIQAINPHQHIFEIQIVIKKPNSEGQICYLPNWIPGSYMIRDFSKHIQWISAESAGKGVAVNKIDKSTWKFAPVNEELIIRYQVYAWDLSVRGAHLDQTHGFFNGTSVFLAVKGQEQELCHLDIVRPEGEAYVDWRVATGLEALDPKTEFEFGTYQAANYDELIDCPVEMADFDLVSFTAGGVPHYLVLVGKHTADLARLEKDLSVICQHHIDFFADQAPFERYLFMTYVLGKGFGGLEHRNSTALHCSREDLPMQNDSLDKVKDSYQTFLDLCSHEYFHSWNIKRIKPAVFLPYQTQRESYTELLWAFEGITSYYDSLALVQSGLISIEEYLTRLAKNITAVQRAKGRLVQTVTESSFDAWSKFYKQDENAPNSVVSYYTKGALVALCLDLLIRQKTDNDKSLQEVMQYLWRQYGKKGIGIQNDTIQQVVEQICGASLNEFFQLALYTTEELPVTELLQTVGIELNFVARKSRNDRGGFVSSVVKQKTVTNGIGIEFSTAQEPLKVRSVYHNSVAAIAGISAADELIALNGLKISAKTFDKRLNELSAGQKITISAFRRDELMNFNCQLAEAEKDTAQLTYNESKQELAEQTRRQWLNIK